MSNRFSGRTILVTGCAGFIGSNLAMSLLQQGARVVGLDDLSSGSDSRIEGLLHSGNGQFDFTKGSITDPDAVSTVIKECDSVINLAAQISVQDSIVDPETTYDVNIGGFLNIHKASRNSSVQRLVYASSAAVYGDNSGSPCSEYTLPRPQSPYAASKIANEHIAAATNAGSAGRLNTIGARFFNVYGANQTEHNGYAAVIPKWVNALMSGEPAKIFGDGSASRDFCYVDDVCAALCLMLNLDWQPPSPVYNIGSGTSTTLSQLHATLVRTMIDCGLPPAHPSPVYLPVRAGDILQSISDISLATEELGYSPETQLAVGLKTIIDFQVSREEGSKTS